MKKFYSLALAALCGIGTVAAQTVTIKNANEIDRHINTRTATAVSTTIRTTADYDNVEWVELGEGLYKSSVVAGTYSQQEIPAMAVTIYEAKDSKGLYKVVDPWGGIFGETLNDMIIDATDPNFVVVPYQNTGILDTVDGITYIANAAWILSQDYDKDFILAEAPELVNVLQDGIIKFTAGTLCLQWPEAPLNSQYGTDPEGWYDADVDGFLALPGVEVKDPWELLSDEATFTDGLVAPVFTGEDAIVSTVSVYRNSETGLYKVANPLKGLYAANGIDAESPELILDATNPDNVMFGMTSTGLRGSSDGVYYYFSEAWYEENYGEGEGGADDLAVEFRITLTEEENVLTFTFPYHCATIYGSGSNKFYYGAPIESTLVVPVKSGVSSVVVDANAPVEYFNLQGVKVENPANGLYIRRQGNVATKVVLN